MFPNRDDGGKRGLNSTIFTDKETRMTIYHRSEDLSITYKIKYKIYRFSGEIGIGFIIFKISITHLLC